jgi:hypothetical protein
MRFARIGWPQGKTIVMVRANHWIGRLHFDHDWICESWHTECGDAKVWSPTVEDLVAVDYYVLENPDSAGFEADTRARRELENG